MKQLLSSLLGKKAAPDEEKSAASAVATPGLWRTILSGLGGLIREPFSGAWQKNKEIKARTALMNDVAFACVSRISSDIAMLPLRPAKRDSNGVYVELRKSHEYDLLKKPNHYQTRQQFLAQWESSIQSRGNAYIYKQMKGRDVVALHIIDYDLVTPMVTPMGNVYYQIQSDDLFTSLTGLSETELENLIPADRIMHDRINAFFHPLIGLSPLYAAAIQIMMATAAQEQQQSFYENGATPGGVLIFPGNLTEETAKKIQDIWNSGYQGVNAGKTAVLGDGVKYERLGIAAEDNQLFEMLQYGAERIAALFHVPAYKVGLAPIPSNNNIEAVNQMYFTDCLQARVTAIQNVLNDGFGFDNTQSFRFDIEALMMMDSKTKMEVATGLRKGGVYKIDESRRMFNKAPVEGGDTIYLQQQDHSIEAIARRDAGSFLPVTEPAAELLPTPPEPEEKSIDGLAVLTAFKKGLGK